MFARIGVMRALNRHVERVFNSDRKDQHWDAGSWRGIDDNDALGVRHAVLPAKSSCNSRRSGSRPRERPLVKSKANQ
jgi:hypothetical protein